MDRFRVEVIQATPVPHQVIYAALHQDYSEDFVWDISQFPSEEKCGEIIVKQLLAGERGHYGPLEHPQITFAVKLPFDYRQHFIVSFNARSLMHFLDLRGKKNAQLEIQQLCELMLPHFDTWVTAIAAWYRATRLGKARLAP